MDLKNEIISRIYNIGFNAKIDEVVGTLINQLVEKGLLSIFGRTEFREDELELLMSPNELVITFNDTDETYIVSAKENRIFMVTNSMGEIHYPLSIEVLDGVISLNVITYEEDRIVNKLYLAEYLKENYILRVTNNDNELLYHAALSSIGSKNKESEVFYLNTYYPSNDSNKSLLYRIMESLNNKNLISIKTSYECLDTSEYCNGILEKLDEYYLESTKEKTLKKTN